MTRRCFICREPIEIGVECPWTAVVMRRCGRQFVVRVCMGCFASCDPESYWYRLREIHHEEGRAISATP